MTTFAGVFGHIHGQIPTSSFRGTLCERKQGRDGESTVACEHADCPPGVTAHLGLHLTSSETMGNDLCPSLPSYASSPFHTDLKRLSCWWITSSTIHRRLGQLVEDTGTEGEPAPADRHKRELQLSSQLTAVHWWPQLRPDLPKGASTKVWIWADKMVSQPQSYGRNFIASI